MKKILILFLTIALLVAGVAASFSACGNAAITTPSGTASTTSGESASTTAGEPAGTTSDEPASTTTSEPAEPTPTEGLQIEASKDGSHAIVKGIGSAKDATEIIIPSVYQDVSVTELSRSAFEGCSNLKSITIPDSVTTIGDGAFFGCTNLTNITIPDSVTTIGEAAFGECSSLTSITIPDGVTSIGEAAFGCCSSLTSIEVAVDNPVYHSAGNCLIDTKKKTILAGLQNSVIPDDDSVTAIGDNAFAGCTGLTSITIPKNITKIELNPFIDCGLTSIEVAADNPVYHSAGNCLIETKSKKLIFGCQNSTIPDDGSVTAIGTFAFCGHTNLTSVIIPDSVTEIGDQAFFLCNALVRAEFKNPNGWYDGTQAVDVSNPAEAAEILKKGSELNRD